MEPSGIPEEALAAQPMQLVGSRVKNPEEALVARPRQLAVTLESLEGGLAGMRWTPEQPVGPLESLPENRGVSMALEVPKASQASSFQRASWVRALVATREGYRQEDPREEKVLEGVRALGDAQLRRRCVPLPL